MFIHDIDKSILHSSARFSSLYQDKYEMWELYQEINTFLGWNQTEKKTAETEVHVTHARINTKSKDTPLSSWKGLCVWGL